MIWKDSQSAREDIKRETEKSLKIQVTSELDLAHYSYGRGGLSEVAIRRNSIIFLSLVLIVICQFMNSVTEEIKLLFMKEIYDSESFLGFLLELNFYLVDLFLLHSLHTLMLFYLLNLFNLWWIVRILLLKILTIYFYPNKDNTN